jgi:hypothetical protein
MSALTINNIALVMCGLLTLICPFLFDYSMMIVYAVLFGFIICKLLMFIYVITYFYSVLYQFDVDNSERFARS